MTPQEWIKKHGVFSVLLLLCLAGLVVFGSLVFDPPEHLSGTVIEKIFVPASKVVGGTPQGMRRGGYTVATVREDQWIAVVRTDKGDTLTVHCDPKHYGQKEVGERIKFREYEGSLLHISYFAHGEEE
jgi:hypothetical protein